jgi:phage tail sheath protein FI
MSNTHTSAGSYITEIDLSQRVANASTTIGAIVGMARSGPVNSVTLITSGQQYKQIFGAPDPKYGFMSYCSLFFMEQSNQLKVVRVENNALSAGLYLTVDDLAAQEPNLQLSNFDDGSGHILGIHDPYNSIAFDPTQSGIDHVLCFICAENPGLWNNNLFIQVRPSIKLGQTTTLSPAEFYIDVFLNYTNSNQSPVESFRVCRDFKLDGFGKQLQMERVINGTSKYIRVRNNPYSPTTIPILTACAGFMSGGTDGSLPTDGIIMNGWDLFADPEQLDVNILLNAGYSTPAVQIHMDQICISRMDCISILDMPSDEQDVANAITYRDNTLNIDSSRSALYTPDLWILDTDNNRYIYVPPSGHVGACYALTDSDAATWFSPAGMSRGDLNILGVRKIYNQNDRDALDAANIDMVRVIPKSGYKVWNDKTLQSEASALSFVNVRRLLNYIEKALTIATLYSVYEPNDYILWGQLRELCERFLQPIQQGRGLYWFKVVCDSTNNTPDTIAAGICNLYVFLDPVIPARRIRLNVVITGTGQITFAESVMSAQGL